MSPKILTAGSLTLDLFLKPRRKEIFSVSSSADPLLTKNSTKESGEYIGFCLGDKIRIEEKHESPGGGGANVAVGLSRFGISTTVLGKIGRDNASSQILKNLEIEGVNTSLLEYDGEHGSGFSTIISADSGERVVLFSPGANETFCHIDVSLLDDYDGICLQHMSGCSYNVFLEIGKYLAKHPEKFVTWNPGRESLEQGAKTFQELLSVLNILLVNKQEAELFTKEKGYSKIFKHLINLGMNGKIIITDGQNGSFGCDGKNIYKCPIYPDSPRVDTLGAGDSYLSGITGAILLKKNLPEAMRFGTMNAARVVSYFGAHKGLSTKTELQQEINKITVSKTPLL